MWQDLHTSFLMRYQSNNLKAKSYSSNNWGVSSGDCDIWDMMTHVSVFLVLFFIYSGLRLGSDCASQRTACATNLQCDREDNTCSMFYLWYPNAIYT